METFPTEDFFKWAGERSLGLDPRYSPPQTLEYLPDYSPAIRWAYPEFAGSIPWFVEQFLHSIDPWDTCWVYRRSDAWNCGSHDDVSARVWTQIVRGIGIPDGHSFVVRFSKSESEALITLAFATICFGWSVYDDLFVIPDHAEQVLYFDHHESLWVRCRTPERLSRLTGDLSKCEIERGRSESQSGRAGGW